MPAPQTEILITVGGVEHARHVVEPGDYVIGRNEDCPLRVDADLVSRQHAKLIVNYDHALIEDLGSSNGTLVNDQPVTERTRLWPNQKIRIGTATVELRRLQGDAPTDMSLAPAQMAIRRMLPAEMLREKKYDIGAVIARGGMGSILDAREAAIERKVAMKVMLDTNDAGDVARFVAEAQVTGQLEHPNIVPVHELGVDENGQPFYTMKMVQGITLKKVLELLAGGTEATVKKYPLAALLTIFQKVCDAIAFAHSRGIIHRDLKPENIMLGDYGEALVMDWGLAKRIAESEQPLAARPAGQNLSGIESTMVGTVMGTPQFMSPEQARGEVDSLDARSDIYSLGAILYQILALRVSVSGADAWEIVGKVGRGEIEPLTAPQSACGKAKSAIPESLAAVVKKAMAFEPAARYATVAELQRDIEAYQGGFATGAENAGAWKLFTLFVKRHKAASIGVAAVILLTIGFMVKVIAEGRRAERGEAKANAALADLKASAPALLQLAESEAGFQRFDSALVKLDAALALDPDLTAGYWRRAWMLLAQEKFAESAGALRIAQTRDPANAARLGAILPLLGELQSAPPTGRWNATRSAAVLSHLNTAGASGEAVALSTRFQISAADKVKLVKARLVEWLGPKAGEAGSGKGYQGLSADGSISFSGLPSTIDTFEPLRGLPINILQGGGNSVKSLEPLRGMPLVSLSLGGCKAVSDLTPLRGMTLRSLHVNGCTAVSDLSPLRGMPLEDLDINKTFVSDLSPLGRMPLKKLDADGTKVSDLAPIHGMPLESLNLGSTLVRDLSPLKNMPLRFLSVGSTKVGDLSPLQGMPLEELKAATSAALDLSPLHGMPLKKLIVRSNDYSPLAGMKLTSLDLSGGAATGDFSTLRNLTVEELKLNFTKVRDLKPLIGLRVKVLDVESCKDLRDLSPLLECTELEELKAMDCPAPIGPLRAHKTLKVISYSTPGTPGLVRRPVEEFWKEFDAQQAAGKK